MGAQTYLVFYFQAWLYPDTPPDRRGAFLCYLPVPPVGVLPDLLLCGEPPARTQCGGPRPQPDTRIAWSASSQSQRCAQGKDYYMHMCQGHVLHVHVDACKCTCGCMYTYMWMHVHIHVDACTRTCGCM